MPEEIPPGVRAALDQASANLAEAAEMIHAHGVACGVLNVMGANKQITPRIYRALAAEIHERYGTE